MRKSTIAMFLNEVVNKSIKEETHASEVCCFMFDSFEVFDKLTANYENFHLIFLLKFHVQRLLIKYREELLNLIQVLKF